MPVEGLIRFDGADNDEYMFSTDSWSGTGEEYVITISKRTGIVSCSCMDSVCRHKRDLVTAEQPRICKHAQAVLRWAGQLTGEQTCQPINTTNSHGAYTRRGSGASEP